MGRPSSKPAWNQAHEGDTAYQIAPSGTQQANGFVGGQFITHTLLNWMFSNISDWIDYFDLGGAVISNVTSGPVTISGTSQTVFADPTSGAFSLVLPSAVTYPNIVIRIKNKGIGSTNVLTVTATAGNIEGGSTLTIAQGEVYSFQSDGTNWWQI